MGNHVRRTGIDGIETVGSSTGTTIVANDVARTPVGVYLEHETHRIADRPQPHQRRRDRGHVEWRHGAGGSSANAFVANRIVRASGAGIFIDVGSDGNLVASNVFEAGARPAIVLQRASGKVVRDNPGCPRKQLVDQRTAHFEDGRPAVPRANVVADPDRRGRCAPCATRAHGGSIARSRRARRCCSPPRSRATPATAWRCSCSRGRVG